MKTFYALLMTCLFILPLSGHGSLDENPLNFEDFVENFSIYPNPSTTGKYTLEFSTASLEQKITIKVFNLIGKQVFLHNVSGHIGRYSQKIDIHNLPKGMYLLEISNGEHKQVRRISYT